MAHSPAAYDRGTRFTNYSSIHSADAFVGDYQVMYTPGSTSPPVQRPAKKSTRFSRTASSQHPQQNISQSYLLPSHMPNTSQIVPDHGVLPNIQVHYNIPADEKQIVASLRSLQRDLAEAMQTISELTKERDEAMHELRLLRAISRKPSSPPKRQPSKNIEEELFDLSSPLQDSPPQSRSNKLPRSRSQPSVQKQATVSDDARVLSPTPVKQLAVQQEKQRSLDRKSSNKSAPESSHKEEENPAVEDTEQSMLEENPTAASNTSRRRRRPSVDENMTSAYILPDITVDHQRPQQAQMSPEARRIVHSLEPEHVAHCEVCRRLTVQKPANSIRASSAKAAVNGKHDEADPRVNDFATAGHKKAVQPDYTAALAGFVDESLLADTTVRPKIMPAHALARVRVLMDAQFRTAKDRHRKAWEKYDRIEAPLSSKKHSEISKEMQHWAEKMEECRVHLDYLRDVEEGMSG